MISFPQPGILRCSASRLPVTEYWRLDDPNPGPYTAPPGKKIEFKSGMILSTVHFDPASSWQTGYFGFARGMFEFRAKLSKVDGSYPALWMYGDTKEIDLVEAYGPHQITTNVHHYEVIQGQHIDTYCQTIHPKLNWDDLADNFHTYTVVWTDDAITFFFDGREIRTLRDITFVVPGTIWPLSLIANLATTVWFDPSQSEAHMDIDYIRVYKPIGLDYTLPYKSSSEWMNIKPASDLVADRPDGSIATSPTDNNHFASKGEDDKIYLSTRAGNNWIPQQIIYNYGLSSLGFPNGDYVDGDLLFGTDQQIFYRGQDARIQSFWLKAGVYQHAWINDSWSTTEYDADYTPRSMALSPDEQVFYKGRDQKIHRYYWGNGSWHHHKIEYEYGSPNLGYPDGDFVRGDLVVASNNQVFYKGYDSRLQSFWLKTGVYQHAWIDNNWDHEDYLINTTAGSVTITDDDQVFYIGTDNKIQFFYWSIPDNKWVHGWIPYNYGDVNLGYLNADYAEGNICYNKAKRLIIYKGVDSRMQYFDRTSWRHGWIDDYWNTDEYLALDNPGDAYSTIAATTGGSLIYVDKESRVREFIYEPCEITDPDCFSTLNLNRTAPQRPEGKGKATTTKENINKGNELVLYPNPASDKLNIYLPEGIKEPGNRYFLFDLSGRIIQEGLLISNKAEISLANIPSGVYLLKIRSQQTEYNKKVVVQK